MRRICTSTTRRGWLALGLCLGLGLGGAPRARADDVEDRAREVKIGILYNLTKFITWPRAATPATHFTFCMFTDQAFSDLTVLRVQGKTAGQLPIQVQTIAEVAQIGGCQLVFIDAGHRAALRAAQAAVGERAILVVSEADAFDQEIGMINLVVADKRLQLEVDVQALSAAKLEASSQLLKLATLRR